MENCSLRLTVFFCCCRLHDGVDFGRLYKMKNVSMQCSDLIEAENESDLRVKRFLMDRSILKVHLPNGGFNMVKYGDATDVKVGGVDTGVYSGCTVVYASSNRNCRN